MIWIDGNRAEQTGSRIVIHYGEENRLCIDTLIETETAIAVHRLGSVSIMRLIRPQREGVLQLAAECAAIDSFDVPETLLKMLFRHREIFSADTAFTAKLKAYATACRLPECILRIRKRRGLELEFSIPESRIYIDGALSEASLQAFESEYRRFAKEISIRLENEAITGIGELIKSQGALLSARLNDAGAPIGSLEPFRRVAVIADEDAPLLPLELLTNQPTVVYCLKSERITPKAPRDKAVLVYSEEIAGTRNELVGTAKQRAKDSEVAFFSAEQFADYQSELSDASMFYFSGHGRFDGNASSIRLGGEWKESLSFTDGLDIAILNACETAASGRGIVGNLIRTGAQSVVASAYRIPETRWFDFSKYLEYYENGKAEEAFDLFRLMYPKVFLFYRYFRNYFSNI